MIRFAFLASALLAAAGAQAQVYKCLDPTGRTIYSQIPCPPSMKKETMSRGGIPPAPAAAPAGAAGKSAKGDGKSAPATPANPANQEQAFRKRQQDAAKSAKEADDKANQERIKAENCNNARQRLATYELGGRISRVDEKGERYYMEDSQIDAEKARARTDVAQACN